MIFAYPILIRNIHQIGFEMPLLVIRILTNKWAMKLSQRKCAHNGPEKCELIPRRHREANPKAVINIGGVKHEVIPTLTHRLHNVMYNTSTGIGIISRKLLKT